jgi:hypothetical protein
VGAFVQHEAVAAEHARLADPALSWRVLREDGGLKRRDEGPDAPRVLRQKPATVRCRQMPVWLIQRLLLEEQL